MDWIPDEFALSGTSRLTVADIAEFAERQSFDPGEEVELLRGLGLSRGERLVEFGSGPGTFALAAAKRADEVIAVDPSPAMCEYLSRRVIEQSARVRVVNAGFLSYRHEGDAVGFVFTKNALHQLPDFWKMESLLRVHRILRPGGVLRLRDLVFSFPPEQAHRWLSDWFNAPSTWSRTDLVEHVRSEFSTYDWVLENMLERAGFEIIDRFRADSGIFAHYTCRR